MESKRVVPAQVQPIVGRFGYAVLSLKGHICINSEAQPAIFTHRKRAVSFRDKLTPHIGKGKIVRVEVDVFIVQRLNSAAWRVYATSVLSELLSHSWVLK